MAPAALAALRRVLLVFADGRVTGSDSREPLSGAAIVSGATIDFGPGPAISRGSSAGPAADELTLNGADTDGLGVGLYLTAVPPPGAAS
jgi:hypothetical protein